jgi:hypothetical protein
MVEFVNNDVIKCLGAKGAKVFDAPQGLNGSKQYIGIRQFFDSTVKPGQRFGRHLWDLGHLPGISGSHEVGGEK